MTTYTYSYLDASAPQINNSAAGQVAAVIKACLVTGYGSKAGAGWTNPYSGTNVEVFRQGAGKMAYLRVDNSASVATLPVHVRLRAYLTMSDASDSGTEPTPTNALLSGGLYLHQASGSASSEAKPWWMLATEKSFHFFIRPWNAGAGNNGGEMLLSFCEFSSEVPSDSYNIFIAAGSSSAVELPSQSIASIRYPSLAMPNCFVMRKYDQLGGASGASKLSNALSASANSPNTVLTHGSGSNLVYPHRPNGGLLSDRILIGELECWRGTLPGLHDILHSFASFNEGDEWDGTGNLAGKRFRAHRLAGSSSSTAIGAIAWEISNTW